MENFLQFVRNLGTTKLLILSLIGVLIFGGLVALIYNVTTPPLSALYANLDIKDSNEIILELESNNIPYEIRAGGSIVMVPEDQVARLRMLIAQKGLPSKGSVVGYEIFDDGEGLGTSHFMQNVKMLRALEGELSRTIGAFANIESARVHLVLPKRELFARQTNEPKASVLLKMRGNNKLSKEQINAITHLVSTAVPGLDPDKITIVDSKGNSLKLGSSAKDSDNNIVSSFDDYKLAVETRLSNVIEDLLERSVGVGKVKAEVSAEINFDKTITNAEIYDPEGQVIRSTQTTTESESSDDNRTNENVTVANNIPNNGEALGGNSSSNKRERVDEIVNYEISKTIKNQIVQTGVITKLSIAVLVDGYYKSDPQTNTVAYQPRTQEEIDKLTALIKSAVGFDEDRNDKIEVVNMQFQHDLEIMQPETWQDWFKQEFASIIQKLIVGIVVIVFMLLVVRPITMRAFDHAKANELEVPSIDNLVRSELDGVTSDSEHQSLDESFNVESLEGKMRSNNSRSLNEVVSKYPQESWAIIKRWLSED